MLLGPKSRNKRHYVIQHPLPSGFHRGLDTNMKNYTDLVGLDGVLVCLEGELIHSFKHEKYKPIVLEIILECCRVKIAQ